MNSTSSSRVGFIGLGSQGGPMARRIIEAGYPVTLWARRPATLEPFADTNDAVPGGLAAGGAGHGDGERRGDAAGRRRRRASADERRAHMNASGRTAGR